MEWKDLEKMTVLKLREEALKFPEIKNVHGKNKEQLLAEVADVLGIERIRAKAARTLVERSSNAITRGAQHVSKPFAGRLVRVFPNLCTRPWTDHLHV